LSGCVADRSFVHSIRESDQFRWVAGIQYPAATHIFIPNQLFFPT